MKVMRRLRSGAVLEVELADWRGTPIDIGSRVVYSTSGYGHSINVYEAEIVELAPVSNEWVTRWADSLDDKLEKEGFNQELYDKMLKYLSLGFKAKAKVVDQPGGFSSYEKPGRLTTFKMNDRIVVIK